VIVKTVKYNDPFDNSEKVEDLYFHLTAAELMEMSLDTTSVAGSMIQRLRERAVESQEKNIPIEDLDPFTEKDIPHLWEVIKLFVVRGYGERTSSGRHRKSQELREEFVASEAYSKLVMELTTDAEKGAEFINGMVTRDLAEQAAKLAKEAAPTEPRPLMVVPDARKVTRKELIEMSQEDFVKTQGEFSKGTAVFVDDDGSSFSAS
jgi:hypothetical protein